MSAISGFCEKCNKFKKRHCDGNRNTCMSILFDTIEALQVENKQLKEQINTAKIGWDTYKTYSEQLEQQIVELLRKEGRKDVLYLKTGCVKNSTSYEDAEASR